MTDVRHLDKSWCPADCTQHALVVTFEDESNSGEEVQEEHEPLARDGTPWLEAHGAESDGDWAVSRWVDIVKAESRLLPMSLLEKGK